MQINLVSCIFILDSKKNENIRKNDIKRVKVLINDNNELPIISIKGSDLKKQVKKSISSIIGTDIFHLEQVYTKNYKNNIDIIYLGVTNINNVSNLKKNYKLLEFNVKNNNLILLGNKEYEYNTIELEENNNIEYIHKINTDDKVINRTLMDLIISYKKIRGNIDNTRYCI